MRTRRALSCSRREDLGWNNGVTRDQRNNGWAVYRQTANDFYSYHFMRQHNSLYPACFAVGWKVCLENITRGPQKKESLESKLMDTINWMLELKNNQVAIGEAETMAQIFLFSSQPPFYNLYWPCRDIDSVYIADTLRQTSKKNFCLSVKCNQVLAFPLHIRGVVRVVSLGSHTLCKANTSSQSESLMWFVEMKNLLHPILPTPLTVFVVKSRPW